MQAIAFGHYSFTQPEGCKQEGAVMLTGEPLSLEESVIHSTAGQAQAAWFSGLAENLWCPNPWLHVSPRQSSVPQEPVGSSVGYWPPHHLPGLAFILQCSTQFSWETPFFLTAKMTSRVISF